MEEKKLVPKRRFKGFEGEWKKEKLEDIAYYRRGSFPQPYGEDKWYDKINGMPFVQVVDVSKNLKLVENTKQKISKLAQPMSVYVEKGKVLVTLQGSIGRVAITQYPSYVDRTLLIFKEFKLKISTYYFAYIIQLLFDIEKLKAPGGTIKTITIEALSEFIVKLPTYEEQQKIGQFFKVLDERIANQERKIAKVKALKEAYLTEMFPQEGETVPKRRFKGFDREWMSYKLGEKVEFITGLTYSPTDIVSNKGTFVLRSSNIKNNQIIDADNVFVDSNVVNSEQVKVGDIVVVVRNGSRDLIGKNAVVRKSMSQTVIGAFMTGIRTKHYEFNNILLNTKSFKKQVAKNLGATINQITIGMFSNMIFNYPEVEEQQKIGKFFKNLDDQISTEEAKLEKLKKMKEAYLEEMFV